MSDCLISIGSNLGDTVAQVTAAVELLRQHPQIDVKAVSSLHETKPAGGPAGQQDFLNAAVRIDTNLAARDLLDELQRIEARLGRVREMRWGPRVVDLDLLLYDNAVLLADDLELPHPRMAFRRFVIEPASEIAGDMLHPPTGWTVSEILAHLDSAPNYVAVAGIPGVGKTALVRAVAGRTSATVLCDTNTQPDLFDPDPARLARAESEAMKQREKLLQKILATQSGDSASREPASFTLSDFWFEQSASFAECFLPSELQRDFMLAFDNLLPTVPRPKLLVVLERRLDQDRGRITDDPRRVARLAAWQRRILQRARIPGRGPTLWLSAEDLSLVEDEVVAAIEAMQ